MVIVKNDPKAKHNKNKHNKTDSRRTGTEVHRKGRNNIITKANHARVVEGSILRVARQHSTDSTLSGSGCLGPRAAATSSTQHDSDLGSAQDTAHVVH